MGAGQSTSQTHVPSKALHVLRVTPSSPASETDIEPFFDFVVRFEGDSLSPEQNIDASQLEKIVESHEGRTLNLLVWNSKNQITRGACIPVAIMTTRADLWYLQLEQWSRSFLRDRGHNPTSMRITRSHLCSALVCACVSQSPPQRMFGTSSMLSKEVQQRVQALFPWAIGFWVNSMSLPSCARPRV